MKWTVINGIYSKQGMHAPHKFVESCDRLRCYARVNAAACNPLNNRWYRDGLVVGVGVSRAKKKASSSKGHPRRGRHGEHGGLSRPIRRPFEIIAFLSRARPRGRPRGTLASAGANKIPLSVYRVSDTLPLFLLSLTPSCFLVPPLLLPGGKSREEEAR